MRVKHLIHVLSQVNPELDIMVATSVPDNGISDEGLAEVKIKDDILYLIGDYLATVLQDGEIEL